MIEISFAILHSTMTGSLLAVLESFFAEVSSSFGKKAIAKKEESPYAFLFITYFIGALVYVLVAKSANLTFIFSRNSIPTFTSRLILEMILGYVGMKSLSLFDRSFFSLSRIMTVPLILFIDIIMKNSVSFSHSIAILCMFFIFIALCFHEKISMREITLTLPLALIPAFTLSLYKYDISHFNSVFGEEFTILCFLSLFAITMDVFLTKENPFRLLSHPFILAQATCAGVASLAASYAYSFGSASLITAIRRASALVASLLSDFFFFKKKIKRFTVLAIVTLLLLLSVLTFIP